MAQAGECRIVREGFTPCGQEISLQEFGALGRIVKPITGGCLSSRQQVLLRFDPDRVPTQLCSHAGDHREPATPFQKTVADQWLCLLDPIQRLKDENIVRRDELFDLGTIPSILECFDTAKRCGDRKADFAGNVQRINGAAKRNAFQHGKAPVEGGRIVGSAGMSAQT